MSSVTARVAPRANLRVCMRPSFDPYPLGRRRATERHVSTWKRQTLPPRRSALEQRVERWLDLRMLEAKPALGEPLRYGTGSAE
jgi:hypothetical protein